LDFSRLAPMALGIGEANEKACRGAASVLLSATPKITAELVSNTTWTCESMFRTE